MSDARTPALSRSAQIVAAWRHITRQELAGALLYGAAVFAMHVLLFPKIWLLDLWTSADTPLRALASDEIGALSLLLALAIANRRTRRDPDRRKPYVAAVLAACISWGLVNVAVYRMLNVSIGWSPLRVSPEDHAIATLYGLFEWMMLNGAAALMYLDHLRARRAQQRLHAAQAERTRAAKRLLESRLQAMQARVEPTFLFDTLAHVRDLYEADIDLAQRVLEDLIAYLRAAMPQMRAMSSSVAQEIELVRAYLNIAALRAGGALTVHIDIAPLVAHCRLPPMILLPLVNRALARRSNHEQQARKLIIACSSIGDAWLRVDVADSSDVALEPDDDERLASVSERLRALYGNRARFGVSFKGERSAYATLEIPLEYAEPASDARSANHTSTLQPA